MENAPSSPYGAYYGSYNGAGYSFHCYPQWPQSGSTGFPAVLLRGLPFNCTECNVYDFFPGLEILDVLLIKKLTGQFSGDAIVVFSVAFQVELALQKHQHYMGRRYIEVYRCKKQEYYHAIFTNMSNEIRLIHRRDHGNKGEVEHTGVLKLQGLPFPATKKDIIDFFSDYEVSEESVDLVFHADGRATGNAFVRFKSAEDSKAAMSRDRMMIGHRYVELIPSTHEDAAAT